MKACLLGGVQATHEWDFVWKTIAPMVMNFEPGVQKDKVQNEQVQVRVRGKIFDW